MHIFVDASEVAYSCVAYFRSETEGLVQVAFVCGKTKVAPLKTISIPRLELKAAVLGTRMLNTIKEQHSLPIVRQFLWSDAGVCLAWIRSKDHRRYHQFVSIRVGEILTSTEPKDWRWVPSKINVADLATKWKNGPQLTMENPWFQGLEFLHESTERWPAERSLPDTNEELRSTHPHLGHFTPIIDISRFSSWIRLNRSVAYLFRYIGNLRRKRAGQALELGVLNQKELQHSEHVLWKIAQAEAFPDEIGVLIQSKGPPEGRHRIVEKSSPIGPGLS